jgi:flavin-binding protein dodecin
MIAPRESSRSCELCESRANVHHEERSAEMADSVYRVTEVIGTSSESWEAAARSAVDTAAQSVRDLRVAEVLRQDVVIEDGAVKGFRVRLAISFKYDSGS